MIAKLGSLFSALSVVDPVAEQKATFLFECIQPVQNTLSLKQYKSICQYIHTHNAEWVNSSKDVHVKKKVSKLPLGLAWNARIKAFFLKKIGYLGQGAEHTYYLWQNYTTGELVAVGSPSPNVFEMYLPEHKKRIGKVIALCEKLRDCPFVIQLHTFFEKETCFKLVQEYGEATDAYTHVTKYGVSFSQTLQWAYDLLRGLVAIAKVNIIHRDLKLENIFLHKEKEGTLLRAKIGDFGLAIDLDAEETRLFFGGSIDYVFPPLLGFNSLISVAYYKLGKRADVWALGLVFYVMAYGFLPWQEHTMIHNTNDITNESVNKIKESCTKLIDLLKKPYEKFQHKSLPAQKFDYLIGHMLSLDNKKPEAEECLELFTELFADVVKTLL